MNKVYYSPEHIFSVAHLSGTDIDLVKKCRRDHNRLGFGYQLAVVRISNRFPIRNPFEILEDVLTYTSVQLCIPKEKIHLYYERRQTIEEHAERIRNYLGLKRFGDDAIPLVKTYIFKEACRLEQVGALLSRVDFFLKEQRILKPAEDTLRRLIVNQRQEAKKLIFHKITGLLTGKMVQNLDDLIAANKGLPSTFYYLKMPPGRPSPSAVVKLTGKLERIKGTGILRIDLSWLNNNFQRSLTRYAKHCDANRLRELEPGHRYATMTCFLLQLYRDTVDHLVDMFDKLINKIYTRAQRDVDIHQKSQRKKIRESLETFSKLTDLILDDSIDNETLRQMMFSEIGKELLLAQKEAVGKWLTGKHSHTFNLVKDRFSYIRQFSPSFLEHLQFQFEENGNTSLDNAIEILREMNEDKKRKLPNNVPIDFIPKKIRQLVVSDGKVEKSAWECALLTSIRDEIKSGNISVKKSKRFGRLDDFFIPDTDWQERKENFFKKAGLPIKPDDVQGYLTSRLNRAYDSFLERLPSNAYASVTEDGWHLSVDSTNHLTDESKEQLARLKAWLSNHMRTVKLPEILIEVDNELKLTRNFMTTNQQDNPSTWDVSAILTTIMAHGCNIGPYTMAQLVSGVSYKKIKNITDWMLNDETQRAALALAVNAISLLDISQIWGKGKTSSSDGQRFAMNRKVLQQTYSPKFNDFALEFYSFVADNYAPFYSLPIECTDRDAPYVLDGLLYNENDLPLDEHYTDTHGYTENNFAAFAMLGRTFSPRIRGLKKQRIYKIDADKDYQALKPLVSRRDRIIHMDWIVEQWDRLGHFYASLECGHSTASTAMKRLNGYTGKNHFYRASRELGRIFKTEHILKYMSDNALRQRIRRGLLKGEQIHALARDLNYGKRGRISKADLREQKNSCSCMTLILACIIYWQAREINRVVMECDPEGSGINLNLMEHISPITWDNVILYGEYLLDQNLIQL